MALPATYTWLCSAHRGSLRLLAFVFSLVLISLLSAGCNLGFERQELAVDLISEDTHGGDTLGTDTTSGDTVEDLDEDTTGSNTFSDRNCEMATAGLEDVWECVGAPVCGASMLTVSTEDGIGALVVCTEAEGLRWHPYIDGEWAPSFQFGGGGDRPVVGDWALGPRDSLIHGVGVVRRAPTGELEWTLEPSLGVSDAPAVVSFGEGTSRPFAGDVDRDGQSEFLTYAASTGTIAAGRLDTDNTLLTPFQHTEASLANIPSEVIFITRAANTTASAMGETLFVFYDVEGGLLTTLQPGESGDYTRLERDVPAGFGATLVDVYPNSERELEEMVVCRANELSVFEVEAGTTTIALDLAVDGTCLPSIERTADGSTTLLVYVPAAGVMLRHQLD